MDNSNLGSSNIYTENMEPNLYTNNTYLAPNAYMNNTPYPAQTYNSQDNTNLSSELYPAVPGPSYIMNSPITPAQNINGNNTNQPLSFSGNGLTTPIPSPSPSAFFYGGAPSPASNPNNKRRYTRKPVNNSPNPLTPISLNDENQIPKKRRKPRKEREPTQRRLDMDNALRQTLKDAWRTGLLTGYRKKKKNNDNN
uniref:Uncharacterized protein n=1 Tax=Metapenaeus joyneri majanivirus TaxID=2984280 RepID=A0A9C7CDY4_9VIRU|nr:MAG: hypothetical protein [Metapenaeus joyneri majanivirus]